MIYRISLFGVLILTILSGIVLAGAAGNQSAIITLDPATTYQTFTNWEATHQSGALACDQSDFIQGDPTVCPAFLNYKDELFDQVVNDLGINRLRVEIYPVVENPTDYYSQFLTGQISGRDWVHIYAPQIINDNDDPNVINFDGFNFASIDHLIDTDVLPIKQRVEAKGEKLLINVNYVDFQLNPLGFEHYDHPQEYAEFVLATYQHMQSKYGFIPDAWEIELEPDNTPFDGTKMGNALQATADLLEANGFTPSFIIPSTTNMSNTQGYFTAIKDVIGDEGVRQYVQEISYHRYSGVTDTALQWIGDTALSYGIGGAMLEHIGSGYQDLHKDLTVGNNSAWAQYTIAKPYFWNSEDRGGAYYLIDDTDVNDPKIIMASRTKFLRQYFKFIRNGAIRIKATTNDDSFNPVSFINTDGKYVVVVNATMAGSFAIQGLPAGTYGVKYTTSGEYDVDANDVTINAGQALNANIPAAGAITIYGKAYAQPTPTPDPSLTERTYLPLTINWDSKSSTKLLLENNKTDKLCLDR